MSHNQNGYHQESTENEYWKGVEKMEPSYTIGGNVNCYSHNGEQYQFSSVQLPSRVRLFATPWIAARQASLSITNSWSSLRLMSIESVMPSSHLILCHPLLLLPPIPPSIRVFSKESILHIRWPKYWIFSSVQFSLVQSLSRVRLFATPWIAECQASLSITISQSSLRLTSIESVMPSSHLILGRPLLLLPLIPP